MSTLCDPMDCSMPGLPIHHQLPELTETHVHRVGDAIQPSQLLSSPSPSAFNLSQQQGLFKWVSYLLKYWSFSFSISRSNAYSGLISFRMDWLDLLAVQGTLKCLLQYHSSKASIIQCSAFFAVQLLHPYMATGQTIALTLWTFVNRVMALLFNTLSSNTHHFPSKEQASFNFMAAVTVHKGFGAPENKICPFFHFFPHLFAMKWWDWNDACFFDVEFQASFFTLLFHPNQQSL